MAALVHASDTQASHHPGWGKAVISILHTATPQLLLLRRLGPKAEWMGSRHADVGQCLCCTSEDLDQ